MPHANVAEVEMEPTLASSPTRLPKSSSSNTRPATALTLLKHAFGKSMLAGTDEWRDVAEVVRSSFLVVSKELKHQDARLRALEANHQQRMEREERDRWSMVHAQLKLFGDELQLLTQQLQHLRDDAMQREAVVQEKLTAQWRACAERDAHVKHKIAKVTRAMEMTARRDELQAEVSWLETRVNKQLHTQNTQVVAAQYELRALGPKMHDFEARLAQQQNNETTVDESLWTRNAVRKLLLVQKQCQQEIKRLQRELFVTYNNHYAAAQRLKTAETIPAVSNSHTMTNTTTGNEAARTKLKHKCIDDVDVPEPCKSSLKREFVLPLHESISCNASKSSPAVKSTHALLKQRFENARRKQQACLTRLRQASH